MALSVPDLAPLNTHMSPFPPGPYVFHLKGSWDMLGVSGILQIRGEGRPLPTDSWSVTHPIKSLEQPFGPRGKTAPWTPPHFALHRILTFSDSLVSWEEASSVATTSGLTEDQQFPLLLPSAPRLDTGRTWCLHSGHEHNEKEGSQRKKWSFIAGGRLSIFIPYLMEFPTGGSFFLLPTPSPTSLPSPSEALEGDPLSVTSHLHTQPP